MDPRKNPYAPGAGAPPPELAGRDDLTERADIALDRIRARRHARSFVYYGLRGVGKTVLLNRVRANAEAAGLYTLQIEAPEGRSLPAMLAPALRTALLKLDRTAAVKQRLQRAMSALAGFVGALKFKYGDLEVSIEGEKIAGLADSGDLETDLADLLETIGEAAADQKTALVMFIDELQYVEEEQLAALISALHRLSQRQLPVTMVAAGLPQLVGQTGRAKSYAERLFEFIPLLPLPESAAREALCLPAGRQDVVFEPAAINRILKETEGYPYFLQEWAKHCWNIADASPISLPDADAATANALAELDQSFFRVRFDRLTPKEKHYLRAMAELGPGPHRSGDISQIMNRPVTSVAPIRNSLVRKGMIYSPAHGDTAFTVPLFDAFMRRVIPELVNV